MEKDCFNGEEHKDHGYDAVVIGSGYGGSVAACRLSMAGLKVCLLEKGRKWEAQDFPTNIFQMLSAVRVQNSTSNFKFGSKDALYQIHWQDDSVAAVACGLGGGSLVNAGVMVPTPLRARRHSRWPEDWEREWELCEASASEMLNVQKVPIKFRNGEIMDKVASDEGLALMDQNPVNLAVNFDIEDQASQQKKKMDSCQACGNCLSGCPYNAKNSVDKTYLASAIQAGCVVRTECEVQYVVRNLDDTRKNRRWLVFLNDFDYIHTDFVILSAGVFGTAKILFQSKMRGLMVSQKLGFGLSCNGNNVAYLARSKAPLNASGLERNKLSEVPFHERPGPSISSSYISSLGNFTIQSAVVPTSFPVLLFKGITTYGWPSGYNFMHGIIDKLMHLFNQQSNDMILNVMGYDDSNGNLAFKKETSEILFHPPSDPLLPRKIETLQKLAKKLGGILFMSRYRSTSVHLLGGCCASSDASSGVCNNNGQVFDTKTSPSSSLVHPGLYVCDASLIPCSVGINPSLTIATASEYVSRRVVKDALAFRRNVATSPRELEKQEGSRSPAVFFRETLKGHVGGLPCIAYLKVKLNPRTFDSRITEMGKSSSFLTVKVSGYVDCKAVEIDKMHVVEGEIDLCQVDHKTPYTQYMHYRLNLAASSGSRYLLEGKKTMNPFFLALNAWKESTTLHMELRNLTNNASLEPQMSLKGNLHISFSSLLATVISFRGHKKLKFLSAFLQSLFRTYISQMPRGSHEAIFTPSDLHKCSYPSDTLHEIKTDDGFRISCRQWNCNPVGEHLFPVLLINGYSTESYCLPTEKTDLVRTFLQQGHETWILQSRLHPTSASSNNMSIEDIGRFDIPSAISKIIELNGASTKIHVVAHCVGGLAMHIALMGGHISCNRIASLSCTNSSMFFKLTAWSKFKLWLPLIPISMAILGKDNLLPMFQPLKASTRQRFLKAIARSIPRYERCSCDECEVFSGIFGNAFWHQNISHKMHFWLNTESLPCLPMAAFPHLRRICNAGFIVDSAGNNSYLIHPERMAVPTLYLSGGRTLLVTPQTSFLANKFMELHQPGFRHERVVVDGFGHSDLLIGEESPEKVFPHILGHVAMAGKGGAILENKKYSKDALSWGEDPYEEMEGGFFTTVTMFILFCFSTFVLLVSSSLILRIMN